MYAVRLWSVRHARLMSAIYRTFERALVASDPLLRRIGYDRLERPAAAIERQVKGLLFDCRMCGQCILGSTGLSCPMNCPKNLRNGPCGGVRPDGRCEVRPEMRCVWVAAFEGSRKLGQSGDAIQAVQAPIDNRLWGRSAWIGVLRARARREEQEHLEQHAPEATQPHRKAA
jgi:Methylene-tetrahydrofolate reductase C terminal